MCTDDWAANFGEDLTDSGFQRGLGWPASLIRGEPRVSTGD
jgi:hypothetical protein